MLKMQVRRSAALLLCFAFIASNTFAEPPTYDLGGKSRRNSAIRSVILPGWGQFNNGQDLKGYVMGGTVLLTLAASYLLYTKANNTYNDYEQLGIKNGSLYDDYQAQANQAMVASVFCAGLWVWNVIDAYIYEDEPLQQAKGRTGLSLACGRGQSGLSYTKKF